MKTKIFSQAAHEFRNPLNGIITSLDLLHDHLQEFQNEFDETFILKYYGIAKNCSNLMLFLVNDILDFAQTEVKKLVLNIEEVNVRELIDQCVSIIKFQADEKEIQIHITNFEENETFTIYTDPNRLKQIIINLLSNAVKYTKVGFICIYIKKKDNHNL